MPKDKLVKLNPAEFIKKNKFQIIDKYKYIDIKKWIKESKNDDNFLISPIDAVEETANQIAYKSNHIETTVRASKCEVVPLPKQAAFDFCKTNHRQTPPLLRNTAISYGLIYQGKVIAVMIYDKSNGAIRGGLKHYELLRLAIAHGYRIHGGASKLQGACESSLRLLGENEIMSYSNATINNGGVYKALGFTDKGISGGSPFAILENYGLTELINLHPFSTDRDLARAGRLKTHVGGNKRWIKQLDAEEKKDE